MQTTLSAGFILAVVLWGILAPDNMSSVFDTALALITRNFGWMYLWIVLGLVLFALFVATSRYGNLRLGGEDEEPEFSVGSWFAMLFAAGMGIGLVWGTLIAGIAISLLLAGGLKAVQTATIVFALPFTLVIVLMVIALWRALRQDWSEHVVRERELRRRMRRMVET